MKGNGIAQVAFTTASDYTGGSPTWTTLPQTTLLFEGSEAPSEESDEIQMIDGTYDVNGVSRRMTIACDDINKSNAAVAALVALDGEFIVLRTTPPAGAGIYHGGNGEAGAPTTALAGGVGAKLTVLGQPDHLPNSRAKIFFRLSITADRGLQTFYSA